MTGAQCAIEMKLKLPADQPGELSVAAPVRGRRAEQKMFPGRTLITTIKVIPGKIVRVAKRIRRLPTEWSRHEGLDSG